MSVSGLASRHAQQATNLALQAAVLAYHRRDVVHYTEGASRWDGITHDRKAWRGEVPRYADCSAFVTWCIFQGLHHFGVRDDVNGAHWREGFTGTMLGHGRHVNAPFPGCAIIYGPGSGRHTAIYTGGGMVVSHGTEAGPLLLPWRYRPDSVRIRSYIY